MEGNQTGVDLDEVRRLYESGLSLQAVGRHVNPSPSRVLVHLRRQGVTMRPPGTIARSQPSTSTIVQLRDQGLTWQQVAEAVAMSPAGVRQRYLSAHGIRRRDPRHTDTSPPRASPKAARRRPKVTIEQVIQVTGWGATHRQAAEMLGLTPGAVAGRLFRARRAAP